MRPVIANQLGAPIAEALAAHSSNPCVLECESGASPWLVEDADVLLTRPSQAWSAAPADMPGAWPGRLRWVQVASAGVDFYPSWLLAGPVVTCGRGTSSEAIADYVLSAILDHEKGLDRYRVKSRAEWRPGGVVPQLNGLACQVLGIAGYGSIGRAVAARARAFGLRIAILRRDAGDGRKIEPDVESVFDIAELAARCDHLLLALPATPATRAIIDADVLARAKPGLHLINVARGVLIDQGALLEALDDGRIGFASLDVTEPEPLPEGHPLYVHPRVRLTPHISWSGGDPFAALTRKILDNLDAYVDGSTLRDIVDPILGY